MNPFEEQAQQYLAEEKVSSGDLQQDIEDVRILGADIQLVYTDDACPDSEAARRLLARRVGRGNLLSYMKCLQGGVPDILLNMDYSAIEGRLCAAAAAGIPLPSPSASGSPTGRVCVGNPEIQEYPTRQRGGQYFMHRAGDWLRQARAAQAFAERVQAAAIRHHAVAMVHDSMEFTNERDTTAFWRELQLLSEVENFANWQAEERGAAVAKADALRALIAEGNH